MAACGVSKKRLVASEKRAERNGEKDGQRRGTRTSGDKRRGKRWPLGPTQQLHAATYGLGEEGREKRGKGRTEKRDKNKRRQEKGETSATCTHAATHRNDS